MKVVAIGNVRYEGKVYLNGQEFDHKDPKKAIELGLLKAVEDGKESESSGVGGSDKKAKGKAGES